MLIDLIFSIASSLLDFNFYNCKQFSMKKRVFCSQNELLHLLHNVSEGFYCYVKLYNEQCIETVQWNDYENFRLFIKWTKKSIIIFQPSYVLFCCILLTLKYQEIQQIISVWLLMMKIALTYYLLHHGCQECIVEISSTFSYTYIFFLTL